MDRIIKTRKRACGRHVTLVPKSKGLPYLHFWSYYECVMNIERNGGLNAYRGDYYFYLNNCSRPAYQMSNKYDFLKWWYNSVLAGTWI